MPNVNIEDKLYLDIKEYCRVNRLTISLFVNDLLRKSFMVEKYDDAPPFFKKKEKESAAATVTSPGLFVEMESMEEAKQDGKENVSIPTVTVIDEKTADLVEIGHEPEDGKKSEEPSPKEKARRRVQYL